MPPINQPAHQRTSRQTMYGSSVTTTGMIVAAGRSALLSRAMAWFVRRVRVCGSAHGVATSAHRPVSASAEPHTPSTEPFDPPASHGTSFQVQPLEQRHSLWQHNDACNDEVQLTNNTHSHTQPRTRICGLGRAASRRLRFQPKLHHRTSQHGAFRPQFCASPLVLGRLPHQLDDTSAQARQADVIIVVVVHGPDT